MPTKGCYLNSFVRSPNPSVRQQLLDQFYYPHHQKMTETVGRVLDKYHHCLIIDGQSSPLEGPTLRYKTPRCLDPTFI